jgi:hypothetical protein
MPVEVVGQSVNGKAFRQRVESEKAELGIEFLEPQPRFWGIAFPPEDWSRAERKMPAAHSK